MVTKQNLGKVHETYHMRRALLEEAYIGQANSKGTQVQQQFVHCIQFLFLSMLIISTQEQCCGKRY